MNGNLEVLRAPQPRRAKNNPVFNQYTCDYCGEAMRFIADAEGQSAECPSCGRMICLGAVTIKPTMGAQMLAGERLRITNRSKLRRFAQYTGWTLFPLSVLALVCLVLTPFETAEPMARGIALLLDLVLASVGLVMMIEGKRLDTRWACSVCHTDLHAWNDIACHSCGAGLR
jgi:DNA-directed RNA polymerase subunit RPC12/RpoP